MTAKPPNPSRSVPDPDPDFACSVRLCSSTRVPLLLSVGLTPSLPSFLRIFHSTTLSSLLSFVYSLLAPLWLRLLFKSWFHRPHLFLYGEKRLNQHENRSQALRPIDRPPIAVNCIRRAVILYHLRPTIGCDLRPARSISAFLASNMPGSCISLSGSTQCPAFDASISTDPALYKKLCVLDPVQLCLRADHLQPVLEERVQPIRF